MAESVYKNAKNRKKSYLPSELNCRKNQGLTGAGSITQQKETDE